MAFTAEKLHKDILDLEAEAKRLDSEAKQAIAEGDMLKARSRVLAHDRLLAKVERRKKKLKELTS